MTAPDKRPRGRPEVPAEDRADVRLELRLNRAQLVAWRAAAAEQGKPLSRWVKEACEQALSGQRTSQ